MIHVLASTHYKSKASFFRAAKGPGRQSWQSERTFFFFFSRTKSWEARKSDLPLGGREGICQLHSQEEKGSKVSEGIGKWGWDVGSEIEAENNLMHSSDVSQLPRESFGFSFFLWLLLREDFLWSLKRVLIISPASTPSPTYLVISTTSSPCPSSVTLRETFGS